MVLIDTPLTADQLLRAFHRDAPYLFMGAAFITVGIVSVAFCALRRRFDALLVWMAAFAFLYGIRLWLNAHTLRLGNDNDFLLGRIRLAINFLVPVPAFLFFRAAGFVLHKTNRMLRALVVIFCCISIGSLIFGPLHAFNIINTVIISIFLWLLLARSLGHKPDDRDFAVVRIGVIAFVALSLWDSMISTDWLPDHLEPFGFAVLLTSLGYVAARRTLERDVALGEIQKELDLARTIQLSILPGEFPQSANFTVAERYLPMTSVAGDFYDYLVTGDAQAGLFIADVSGHGVPAALIASMVKMAATSQRLNAAHPAQVLNGLNAALCGNTQGQFVTAAYVYLDASSRQLLYSAAGHPAMFLLRNGAVIEIVENGLVLAAVPGSTYAEKTVPLETGDRLLLYTDGLVEARNAAGALFGEEALIETFRATGGLSPTETADRLIGAAQQWAKSQEDDLTVLVCDFLGAE